VLILRDVLGFSAREAAEALDTSPASVDSALQRAHRTVDERLPERSQQATLRALGDERLRGVVEEFVAAWERADVDAVVSLLVDDPIISMPPRPSWYRGREAVAAFLAGWALADAAPRLVEVRANGQLAFGDYRWDAEAAGLVPHALIVLTLRGARIAELTAFLEIEDYYERFGLPGRL
jgi:RNA polymerase sigma-70 factor (ECF subfamily)